MFIDAWPGERIILGEHIVLTILSVQNPIVEVTIEGLPELAASDKAPGRKVSARDAHLSQFSLPLQ